MNKKVLTIIGLVALVAILATGAFAYFSSETTNTGNISAGTLTLKVAGGDSVPCSGFGDSTTVWSMANMAPGEYLDGYLCMKNIGTVDAKQVTFEWVYDDALRPLADHIFITSIYDSIDTTDYVSQIGSMCDTYAGSVVVADGKCSLTELAHLSEALPFPFDAVSDGDPFLPGGGSQWLYIEFQFDPLAGNEFQGLGFDYDLIVTAEQVAVFP